MQEIHSIGFELRSLHHLIMRKIELAAQSQPGSPEAVTCTNGWIIRFLAENTHRDIYQKDLEEHFSITRSTASKVLTLMEKKGLIQRLAVPHDARLKRLMLTDKAHQLTQQMRAHAAQFEGMLTQNFTAEELQFFIDCIRRMKENIQ